MLVELPETPGLDPEERAHRLEDALVLRERLGSLTGDPRAGAAIDASIASVNEDPDALDRLLESQHYRLAWWRASSWDLGYRRFFDINSLVGLRVEDPAVFEDSHRLILGLVAEGSIQGLRVDHLDGLRDPQGYLERLRAAAPGAWIVVEKILAEAESLPGPWPVEGTTGYELAALATRQLVDADGLAALDRRWRTAAPELADWATVAEAARREVIRDALGSDLNRLSAMLLGVCEANRRFRDFTRHELHAALHEVVSAVDVYRTYGRPDGTI
jgi:(1->4)-alpha-D-glucan 1-alpha-D-glucosylmutase